MGIKPPARASVLLLEVFRKRVVLEERLRHTAFTLQPTSGVLQPGRRPSSHWPISLQCPKVPVGLLGPEIFAHQDVQKYGTFRPFDDPSEDEQP